LEQASGWLKFAMDFFLAKGEGKSVQKAKTGPGHTSTTKAGGMKIFLVKMFHF